jgi:hypothetical protein
MDGAFAESREMSLTRSAFDKSRPLDPDFSCKSGDRAMRRFEQSSSSGRIANPGVDHRHDN